MTTKQAAHILGVTPRTIQNWINKGKIKAKKLPKEGWYYDIPESEVERLQEE